MDRAADLDDADSAAAEVLERFDAFIPALVRGDDRGAVEGRHFAPLPADDLQPALGREVIGGGGRRGGADIERAGDDALRHRLRRVHADHLGFDVLGGEIAALLARYRAAPKPSPGRCRS